MTSCDAGRYVVEGSPDQLCFLMKYRAKAFSRNADLVGMLAISGPAGGGKGTVLYEARNFGGDVFRRTAVAEHVCSPGSAMERL